MDPCDNFLIQLDNLHGDLKYTIGLILDFNEELNQIWFENIKIKK